MEMPNDHVVVDLDTPEAYAAVEQRLASKSAQREEYTVTG
jgi:hypothetical protein